jgi:serine/threonine protein kinase
MSSAEEGEGPALTGQGPRVARYTLLKEVGQGGMGVVYAAYDPGLDRKVALKLLRPGGGRWDRAQARARLQREAQAMAGISHPNVTPVFDVGQHQEQVFVAMEFFDGGTLREWLQQQHSWREVLSFFLQAGQGLMAAHDAALIHRDFKPANVLISQSGRVCVSDFGLARPVESFEEMPLSGETLVPLELVPALRPRLDVPGGLGEGETLDGRGHEGPGTPPPGAFRSMTCRLTARVSFFTQSPCTASISATSAGPATRRWMRSSIWKSAAFRVFWM